VKLRPYKFLDYYTVDDREIFFGRHREIEILLADVISARLVVLFAKTGTGKSSLINAGVRPRLEALKYRTFLARVGQEPIEGVRDELRAAGLLLPEDGEHPLRDELTQAVTRVGRPIVIFFDQFEEFFLLAREKPEATAAFIKEIGAIHRNALSGVHLVFSLREDYLAEMDAFRDEIPTIFRSESQLRLRPLTAEQAAKAIDGPKTRVDPAFRFDEGLVEIIARDLRHDGNLISPVSLQIVCDTLWQARAGDTITHALYEEFGGARGILTRRLEQDIAKLSTDQLLLLEKLIPILTTRKRTKQAIGVTTIESELGLERVAVIRFLHVLTKMRLLRLTTRDSEMLVEWVSDYLAGLTTTLRPGIQLLWVRRLTPDEAIQNADVLLDRTAELLDCDELLPLLEDHDWMTVLLLALASRDTLGRWFTAAKSRTNPWVLIDEALTRRDLPEARLRLAMLYLGEFNDEPPIDILKHQLSDPDRAEIALRALGAVRNDRVVDLVAARLDDPDLRAAAMDALRLVGSDKALKLLDEAASKEPGVIARWFSKKKRDLPAFREEDWTWLLRTLRRGYCIPLLGPSEEEQQLHKSVAGTLAKKYRYPFANGEDVAAVVEYLGILFGGGARKVFEVEGISDRLNEELAPSALEKELARYPISLFLTTSYATTLPRALAGEGKRPGRRGMTVDTRDSERPFVHHIFGAADDPDSLALTSQDVATRLGTFLTDSEGGIPTVIRAAATRSTLLVAGLDVADLVFSMVVQAMFGGAAHRLMLRHLIIIPPPVTAENTDESFKRAVRYLNQYAIARGFKTFWGTQDEFAAELAKRWGPEQAAAVPPAIVPDAGASPPSQNT
jgi:hypothetical protein